jgi:rhamnulokinase
VFVAVDLGGESGRIMSASVDENGIRLDERHRFDTAPTNEHGHLVWDVERFHRSILDGLAATPGAMSVGIDGWGVDFALLRSDGSLAAPPRSYRDPLTAGILPELFSHIPRRRLFERTGIQMMEINTVCQLLAMSLSNEPALAAAQHLLLIPDLLLHWLGAEPGCERTNASTTQMLGLDGAWAADVLTATGVPRNLLPGVVEPGTVRGSVGGDRVPDGTSCNAALVSVASHDTASAVVATPLPAGGDAVFISSGTWSLVGTELSHPVVDDFALRCNLSNEHGHGGTVRLLRNVMGLWLLQQCRRTFRAEDGRWTSYEDLVATAAAAPAFAAVVDPDNAAFLRTEDLPRTVAELCTATRQAPPPSRAVLVRMLMESLALRYRWTIEALSTASAQRFRAIHVVGGGSRNRFLCQLTADATGLPVTAGPAEATATGNVIVQAIATGHLEDVAHGRRLVATGGDLLHFEPIAEERWERAYERFCALPGVGRPGDAPAA